MTTKFTLASPVALPAQSAIAAIYQHVHLADAFEIRLPPGASRNADELARFIFSSQPAWTDALMKVRDVHCHNLLGRAYLFVIAPFHRLVVKASLRRAAHIGWPRG
jgi:hypothetical protein